MKNKLNNMLRKKLLLFGIIVIIFAGFIGVGSQEDEISQSENSLTSSDYDWLVDDCEENSYSNYKLLYSNWRLSW